MDQTSSIVTGGVTLTAASLVPAVQWISAGCKTPMPLEVQLLVASAIVTGIHAVRNVWAARLAARAPQAPAAQ